MKAILRAIRITPKKANLMAGLVRNQPAKEALTTLKYIPKKSAKIMYKLLASAIANAVHNFKQDENTLLVKEVIIGKGATFKRGVPVSRGRVYPILKRTSNITIILEVNEAAVKTSTKKTDRQAATAEPQTAVKAKTAKPSEKAPKATKKPAGGSRRAAHIDVAAKKTTK